MTTATAPVLEAKGLVKVFGRVVGLNDVDLTLYPGEVLAVIGDNGAGKSTLIKCLSGALVPDQGSILVDGSEVNFKRPQDAREAGIETVYQTLAVAPALDIASNLFLAREIRRKGVLGSLIGALIVQVFVNGLALAGIDPNYQVLTVGVLVIAAVSVDQWIRSVKS